MSNKTVILIMVDALRHDYITETDSPFLFSLAKSGALGSLIPSFGFEPDGAYFAGLDPEECDGCAQFWRNPNQQDFYFTPLFRLFQWVPFRWWEKNMRRAIRLIAQLLSTDSMTKKLATTAQIPLSVLSQFSISMRKIACERGFTPTPTIFDVVKDNGKNFFFHSHPAFRVRTDNVVTRFIKEEQGNNALTFLMIADLDSYGHIYGPNSIQRRDALRHVDQGLKKIYEHASNHYDTVDMLVFGDHGMVEVNQLIDLRELIKKAELDPKEDSYFLDSPFARFWVPDISRRKNLVTLLNNHAGGHILDQEEIEKYKICHPHNYFGDIIYVVDDGVLIHPSFYSNTEPPKGMHGYLPGCRDNESAFLLSSERAAGLGDLGRVDMRRIFPTTLDLLGLVDKCAIPHNLKSIL